MVQVDKKAASKSRTMQISNVVYHSPHHENEINNITYRPLDKEVVKIDKFVAVSVTEAPCV